MNSVKKAFDSENGLPRKLGDNQRSMLRTGVVLSQKANILDYPRFDEQFDVAPAVRRRIASFSLACPGCH